MSNNQCTICRHYHEGYCRRHAPVCLSEDSPYGVRLIKTVFPKVDGWNVCGDFEIRIPRQYGEDER